METIDYKGFTIKIQPDTDASNPIEDWDGNAKYALFHSRYNLQNDVDLDTDDYNGWDEFKQALIEKYKPLAILPVYMYDHSGQTIRTTPFSCRWDSGQLGFVFVDLPTLKEWGYDSKEAYEKGAGRTLEEDLISNVSLYDDYITGNVWGFELVDSDDDTVDSCWGFYGDSGKEEAISQAKQYADSEVLNKDIENLKELNAIVHTRLKLAYLKFEGELHKVNLTEGDLKDNWNAVTLKDGRVFDFNMDWQFCLRNPSISLYGTYQEEGEEHLRTDTSDSYSFKVLRKYKKKSEYFPKQYYTGFDYELN